MNSDQTAIKTTAPTIPSTDYTIYNIAKWIHPIWVGDTVYNETVMFVPNAKTKEIESAPLMYTPDKIISVRSFNLLTEYTENVDYVIENGRIKLTNHSRIRVWKYDDYYRPSPDVYGLPSISAPGRYLKYGAGPTFQKTQICVTYTHKDAWKGPCPEYQGDKLPKTMQRLKNKKPLSIVYNGDSVAVGAEASKWNNMAPYTPIWTDMVTEELESVYGSDITTTNTAVGGTNSAWGLQNVRDNILKYHPDLVVLRFGGNDGTQKVSAAEFQSNIEGIIHAVREENPDSEFILVSPDLPNPDAEGWMGNTPKYQKVLENICRDTSGVALAKMTDMSEYLLTKKRYWDMTGNNINHPNDFYVRVIAQVVSSTMIDKW